MDISPVQISSQVVSELLVAATSKTLEQATDLARLNLELQASQATKSANAQGIGAILDIVA
jgi:hypothetical protein